MLKIVFILLKVRFKQKLNFGIALKLGIVLRELCNQS